MPKPPARIVTLVLVTAEGDVLGQLPRFPVETPWWQDAGPIVAGARARFGLGVTVLRLLETEFPSPHGGAVTYLAQADRTGIAASGHERHLAPWDGTVTDDPRRLPYARPGGPASDLAWADAVLDGLGQPRSGPAEQDRTWNLSSLWRLPLPDGAAWLKVVPPFFGHEGGILGRLAGEAVPELLAADHERMLLAQIPGEDQYDARRPALLAMVDILVDLQDRWIGRLDGLLELGLPDWRGAALAEAIGQVVERTTSTVPAADRGPIDAFVNALPDRIVAIEACGIPDSLVHGDFHPGNVRGGPGRLVLLDWGDSGVGHPLLDQPAFLTRIDHAAVETVRGHWHEAWRRAAPGSDPGRAARLLAPMAAARQAVIYQRFLDQIEASEQVYHRADVPDWLTRTAEILGAEDAAAM